MIEAVFFRLIKSPITYIVLVALALFGYIKFLNHRVDSLTDSLAQERQRTQNLTSELENQKKISKTTQETLEKTQKAHTSSLKEAQRLSEIASSQETQKAVTSEIKKSVDSFNTFNTCLGKQFSLAPCPLPFYFQIEKVSK